MTAPARGVRSYSGWLKYPDRKTPVASRPRCDRCYRGARWIHPLGGIRCDRCPRPEVKMEEK